ncbi:MAG TPA: Uma2 family endonuclease [Verrucomicrobiae bacterium]|jgi:Uma2 family endonuclease|nr:Uma2 family endonuclease [Verrucomicrobiae bacterium]
MSDPYEEILDGELSLRLPPGSRHEQICERLHERMAANLTDAMVAKLLPMRSLVEVTRGTKLRPDLALVTTATNKLWLAAEVINSGDHHADTVLKKAIYEETGLPRLWMVDPRYDNVEIYHGGEHGMVLKQILALQDVLTEALLPSFAYRISELFRAGE